jgi:hypothetical protein
MELLLGGLLARPQKTIKTLLTENFLMVQAPGFISGINPKSLHRKSSSPEFIRGVNPKSKI